VEPGEEDAEALRRELEEELGLAAEVGALLAVGRDTHIELYCYRCALDGVPRPDRGQSSRWVPLDELSRVDVPPADRAAIEALVRCEGKVS